MLRNIFIFILVFLFAGCSKNYPYLPTVKKVDIQKYKGTWYEIARFEHSFEKGCKNVTASYKIKENGEIKVLNKCVLTKNGENKDAEGIAYAVDDTNSKLKVSFFRPFYGDYWILDLADDYSYALVGSPNREYLWILSRTKTVDNKVKDKILSKLPKLGFDSKKFIWTIQE